MEHKLELVNLLTLTRQLGRFTPVVALGPGSSTSDLIGRCSLRGGTLSQYLLPGFMTHPNGGSLGFLKHQYQTSSNITEKPNMPERPQATILETHPPARNWDLRLGWEKIKSTSTNRPNITKALGKQPRDL